METMIKSDPAPVRRGDLVFVLLGEQFEEATAAILTTTLRQVGLCVKLIGLAGQKPSGKNGLAFYPDLTLREALKMANNAACVILPCSASALKLVEGDPRIADFFQKSCAAGAQFIVSNIDLIEKTGLKNLSISDEQIVTYGAQSDLLSFAGKIAADLSNACGMR